MGVGRLQRLRILLSAFDCAPESGSDPGTGWGMARQIAKYHEVWVLTRAENRLRIEAEIACDPSPHLHFVYYDFPNWMRWWVRGEHMKWNLYYYPWQFRTYFLARRLHRRVHFDLVHHVTIMKYWLPSFLSLLPVPFIWGPVGGGESAPRPYYGDLGLRGRAYETLRDVVRWLGEHDPFLRLTARRSVLACATTQETAARVRKLGAKSVRVLSGVLLTKEEVEQLGRYSEGDDPVRLISIGRLLHWKGFHYGLRAFAEAKLPWAEYWIVGDGPERSRLETLTRALGLEKRVHFWGALDREETLTKLGKCHVLVHPSLHDSGGSVCLEAMAAGRPVVCLNTGGPATLITEEAGFKIPISDPNQTVHDLANAITRLIHDPELRTRMGGAGRRRVSAINWETRGYLWIKLYKEILLGKL